MVGHLRYILKLPLQKELNGQDFRIYAGPELNQICNFIFQSQGVI